MGFAPQYALVVDGRPDPIVVVRQEGPGQAAVIIAQGRRGAPGEPGAPGFILVGPDDDIPPEGTPDGTFVFQQV